MTAASPDARLLIVNADDFALTERVSEAIVTAHVDGIVTSTSVLAVTPAFDRSIRLLERAPQLGVGVHLAAVGEDPPLLSAREVPTLVDRRGRLAPSWRRLVPRVAAGRIDPADLHREFSAQLERVRTAGVTITHLDTHQHIHLWPSIAEVVLAAAAKEGCGVRITRSAARSPVGVVVRHLSDRLERRVRSLGLRCTDAAAGLDEAGGLTLERLRRAVALLAQESVAAAELSAHPGGPDDPERQRYAWDYAWEDELAALTDPSARAAVVTAGFRLGTYADLAPA